MRRMFRLSMIMNAYKTVTVRPTSKRVNKPIELMDWSKSLYGHEHNLQDYHLDNYICGC